MVPKRLSDTIEYHVNGSVDVSLLYGGNSDGAEIKESFPFTCMTIASARDPVDFDSEKTEMKVDTSSWHGDDNC
jgi:hypothetical protein